MPNVAAMPPCVRSSTELRPSGRWGRARWPAGLAAAEVRGVTPAGWDRL